MHKRIALTQILNDPNMLLPNNISSCLPFIIFDAYKQLEILLGKRIFGLFWVLFCVSSTESQSYYIYC